MHIQPSRVIFFLNCTNHILLFFSDYLNSESRQQISNLKIISVEDLSSVFNASDEFSSNNTPHYEYVKSEPVYQMQLPSLTRYDHQHAKRFQCEQCGKSYTQMSTLRRHQNYDCGKAPNLKCDFCEYRSKYKFNLLVHIDRRHKRKWSDFRT